MFPLSPLNLTAGHLSSCKHSLVNSLLEWGLGESQQLVLFIRYSSTGRLYGSWIISVTPFYPSDRQGHSMRKHVLQSRQQCVLKSLHVKSIMHLFTLTCCLQKKIWLKFVINLSLTVQLVCGWWSQDTQKCCPLELEIQTRAELTWFSL